MLSVVVPIFNERPLLPAVIDALRKNLPPASETIYVDDGSTDGSSEFLRDIEAQRRTDEHFIFQAANRGRGAAVRAGLAKAKGNVICPHDADLEYDPGDIADLAASIFAGNDAIVYGSRFLAPATKGMSRLQSEGNRLLTSTCNFLYGSRLTDLMTCHKVWRADVVRGLTLASDGFEFEAEVTAKALLAGHRIREKPTRYAARSVGQGKKLTWRAAAPILFALLRYRLSR